MWFPRYVEYKYSNWKIFKSASTHYNLFISGLIQFKMLSYLKLYNYKTLYNLNHIISINGTSNVHFTIIVTLVLGHLRNNIKILFSL